jgi:Family of unknown function (DUF5681)
MPFRKGQSGNPGGRPKTTAFGVVLAQQLDAVRAGTTTRERIAAVVVEKALKGDLDAVKWIADRVDGRAPERLEVDATVEQPVTDATIDAVLARAAARNGLGAGAP